MLWKKILAVAIGCGLGLVLAVASWELWGIVHPATRPLEQADRAQLRQLLDENPNAIFMFDETTAFRYKPNFHGYRVRPDYPERRNLSHLHVTNSLSLLGNEEINPDPRVAKVLLLGDSVTYGVWVDAKDIFPARMQQLAGPGCQLLVGACEGWSTKQEIAFYDRYLRGIDWRAVLLVFCLNDLVDYEWSFDTTSGKPELTEEILAAGNGGTKTNQSLGGLKLAALRHQFGSAPETAPLARQTNTALWAWEDGRWGHYLNDTLAPFVDHWSGPPLSIVMAPTASQLKALALGAPGALALYPQMRLKEFCERHRLTCIDLKDAFSQVPLEGVDGMFIDDLHFNEAGHALIAGYLWPRVQAMLGDSSQTSSAGR